MYEDLFKIKHHTLIMLQDRGYVIPSDEAELLNENLKTGKFIEYFLNKQTEVNELTPFTLGRPRPSMSNIYYKKDKSCLVYFSENSGKKISKAEARIFSQMIINFNVNEAIIVSAADVSSEIEKIQKDNIVKGETTKNGQLVQFFKDEELYYNPMNHIYVPKHRILTPDEVREMKEVDNVDPRKLPQISSLDPIAKRLGAGLGDVIEITRHVMIPNCLIEEEISYRTVYIPQIANKK